MTNTDPNSSDAFLPLVVDAHECPLSGDVDPGSHFPQVPQQVPTVLRTPQVPLRSQDPSGPHRSQDPSGPQRSLGKHILQYMFYVHSLTVHCVLVPVFLAIYCVVPACVGRCVRPQAVIMVWHSSTSKDNKGALTRQRLHHTTEYATN